MSTGKPQAPERVRLQRKGFARILRAAVAVASVTVVLTLVGVLIALPALERKPDLLAGWLSEYLDRNVVLSGFELLWSGGSPVLKIRDLRLAADDRAGAALALDTAEVRIDALRSLRERSIRPQAVTVRGVHVGVERADSGALTVIGFGQRSNVSIEEVFRQLVDALPRDASVGVEQGTITLKGFTTSAAQPTTIVLHPVNVRLQRNTGAIHLSATATSRDHPGPPLRATVRWSERVGNPLTASEFTLSTQSMPLSSLPMAMRPQRIDGNLSFAVDGQIIDSRVDSLRGTLKVEQLDVRKGLPRLPFTGVHSLIELVHDEKDWRLTLLRMQSQSAGGLSTPSTLTVSGSQHSAPHTVSLDHMQAGTALPLLSALAPSSDALKLLTQILTPAGRIENLELGLSGDLTSLQPQQLRMSVRDAILRSAEHRLEMGPVDATLTVGANGGSVHLQAATTSIGIKAADAEVAREARFTVGGTVNWQHSGDGLLLHSAGVDLVDGDLRARIAGTARFSPSTTQPELDLQLRGGGLDAQAFHRWLDYGLLPAPLAQWLSQAIVSGQLVSIDARLRGAALSPETMLEQLELRAQFADTTLRYLEGWPELTDMSGEFSLNGKRFAFNVAQASASNARITSTSGEIANVLDEHPVLTLQGNALGRAEQAAAFMSATPIGPQFEELMKQLGASGNATLQLDLTVPLTTSSIKVSGLLKLLDNQLKVSALRSALEKVSGAIRFDAEGLTQARLKARYLQHDISVSLDGMLADRNKTRLVIEGATDPQGLLRHLWDVGAIDSKEQRSLPLLSRLSGRTNWQVTLDIGQRASVPPGTASTRERDANIELTVRSDLAGMALDLPSPLGKAAGESRMLVIRSLFNNRPAPSAGTVRRFSLQYGKALNGVLEMRPQAKEGFVLHRGALRFGGGAPTLEGDSGITVSGAVSIISVDEWAALIAELEATSTSGRKPRQLDHIKSIRVLAQQVVALGAVFGDVALEVVRNEAGPWRITTNGIGINGSITIPEPIGKTPIKARFERLHVHHDSGVSGDDAADDPIAIDPRGLPSAQVVVQRLRYNDIELGLAKLVLEPVSDGIAIREIYALSDAFELRGSGHWSGPAARAQSRFDLRLHSNDFGQFTKALGYGDSGIQGGVAEVAITSNWYGSPFEFALDNVQGQLHFRGTGGRLLDVEPGATGRVFGLLNVTVLPRRLLLLDFKDLFEEGVSYELIEGSFALSEGDALTDNVVMQTQTAQVELTGRVGLVAQDYDQTMTVTPKLSASLPLAPIWLAEKLFNRKLIDNAFSYQYIITGSWDEPNIERVRVEAVRPETR